MRRIEISSSEKTDLVDVLVDVDFTLNGSEEDRADLADVLSDVVLTQISGKKSLPPGKYNIRMLCVLVTDDSAED